MTREHLATLMEFEADRMTGLVLTDDDVLPERNVVLEEHNMRVANSPGAQARRADRWPRSISIIPMAVR